MAPQESLSSVGPTPSGQSVAVPTPSSFTPIPYTTSLLTTEGSGVSLVYSVKLFSPVPTTFLRAQLASDLTPGQTLAPYTFGTVTVPVVSSFTGTSSTLASGSSSVSTSSLSSMSSPSTTTPSSYSSTSSETPSITAINATTSSNSTSSATGTPTPIQGPGAGYIAGLAVLAALLLIALGALAFLIFHRNRRSPNPRGEYEPPYELKSSPGAPHRTSLENTINSLETQLHQKDVQLRDSQAALLQAGRRPGVQSLDDRQVQERFSRLIKSINDWVVTHFKIIRPGAALSPALAHLMQSTQPNYSTHLQGPRTKYLVLRGLVAEIIGQAFTTDEFIGNPTYNELKQAIASKSSAAEANEWKALTVTLLEKTLEYRTDRTAAVQDVAKRIDDMTSNLAGLGPSEIRSNHLRQLVDQAAGLALDLAKQSTLFKVEKPSGSTFDTTTMEDVLQDSKGEVLHGRPIDGIIFPAVSRWGDESGGGYDRAIMISKAQVLV